MIKKIKNRLIKRFFVKKARIENMYGRGKYKIYDKEFYYHHENAFKCSFKEIIENEIYRFKPDSETPTIIDCGVNMGLSLLFFTKNYPKSKIIAFEPDPTVLPTLDRNISVFMEGKDITLLKKAVWVEETELDFFSDGGLGGRLQEEYKNKTPEKIKTVRLKSFLRSKVDFLKLDIEGAEYDVLMDCKNELKNVDNVFVEYHSANNSTQKLDDILKLLKDSGFRYHLKESFSRDRPFIDKKIVCQRFDMAINIFAYKKQ
ncbi:FkbM family methyltransferase [Flavobacteriaceae bacterium 144Ye]|nr:FkbM family methyltransferase [Flavobacteriaceae bacterium 144Ye]